MKKITKFAAVALLVAGSIACTDPNKPAETTTDQPVAVSATETSATTETSTTIAPEPTDTTATTTDAPVTATDATSTDATTSAPANPPAQQ